MIGGVKVCYGSVFYEDIGIIEYEGGYYKNKWFGFGRLYDKKNELTYEGEWCIDNPMGKKSVRIEGKLKEEDLHFGLEEIMINGCFDNIERFRLIGFSNLKKLVIENGNLKRMTYFSIEECDELTNMKLGGVEGKTKNQNEKKSMDRVFRISNCKNLLSITIGNDWYQINKNFVLQGHIFLKQYDMNRSSFSSDIHYRSWIILWYNEFFSIKYILIDEYIVNRSS